MIDVDQLFAADFSGILHCLDVQTGKPQWTYDALAAIWCPPFVADGKLYLLDEDGDVSVFETSTLGQAGPVQPLREINMRNSCYTSPTASRGVLFIASKSHLFAIQKDRP